MMLALFALANLRHDMAALWGWLCHRSFWQLAFGAMTTFALIQHFELGHARREAAKWQHQFSEEKRREAAALATALRITDLNQALTDKLRKANDETQAANAAAANALRLSGPGKARCTAVPASPGGHGETSPAPNAPVAPMPDGRGPDLIALPFDDATAFGESHDDLLAENRAWRTWHDEVLKVWPKNH